MKNKDERPEQTAHLRKRAEKVAREKAAKSSENTEALSPEETRRLLHELRVHQIELEMQNEELRRSHVKLDAARARYFNLYELAPVGYCIVSEKGLILEVNLTAVTLLGVARDAIVKEQISRFIFKEDQDIYYLYRKQLFDAGELQSCELRMVKKNGTIFWARMEATVAQNTEGAPVYRFVLSDITERKQAEEALRASEVRYRRFFESLTDGILILDAKTGMVVDVNPFLVKLLGFPREQFVGKRIWELGLFKDIAANQANFLELQQKKHIRYEDLPLETTDGRQIDVEFVSNVYEVDHQKMVQCNIRDITERKRAEDERKNLLEQLVRSEKLAAVGELISGVAHEINNPLTGIVGLSELLLREDKESLDEDTRKDLESIYQSSERIRKIVANLLRFARREAPARKDANINELLDTVLNIRSYEMKVRNVELKKNYQIDLPLIMADPSQLEQVFLNLITNAEYAIHETGKPGTLTIATSLQEEQPEHKKVIIEFSDTGTGIPENVFSKLFNPFFTTKPVGKGTGLGLSVSYGIIKEHGGEISAGNRAEGGAVFTIKLPISGGGKR